MAKNKPQDNNVIVANEIVYGTRDNDIFHITPETLDNIEITPGNQAADSLHFDMELDYITTSHAIGTKDLIITYGYTIGLDEDEKTLIIKNWFTSKKAAATKSSLKNICYIRQGNTYNLSIANDMLFSDLISINEAKHKVTGSNFGDYVNLNEKDSSYTINSGNGNDHIIGTNLNDSINGGNGDDYICGKNGDDVLTGGKGTNTYAYNAGILTNGNDTIQLTKGEIAKINYAGNSSTIGYKLDDKGNALIYFDKNNTESNYITLKDFAKRDLTNEIQLISADNIENLKETHWYYAPTSSYNGLYLNEHIDAKGIATAKTDKKGHQIAYSFKTGNGNDIIESTNFADKITAGVGENEIRYTSLDQLSGDTIYLTKNEKLTIDLTGISGNNATATYALSGKDLIVTVDDGNTSQKSFTIANFGTKDLTGINGKVTLIDKSGVKDLKEDALVVVSSTKGTFHSDIINGGNGNDTIKGGAGNDIISGESGNDKLYGEAGENTIVFKKGDGVDTVYGGEGTDTLKFSGISIGDLQLSRGTAKNNQNDLTIKYSQNDSVTVKDYYAVNKKTKLPTTSVKYITTNEGSFYIDPLKIITGNLEIYGDNDSNFILGSNFSDTIKAFDGNDVISGGDGADIIYGGDGDDTINGSTGNDSINGGSGNNTIFFEVGAGSDTITSGDGQDTLLFVTPTDISFYRDFTTIDLVINYGENDKITLKDYYKENTTHSVTTIINGNTTYSIPDAIDAYGIEIVGLEIDNTINCDTGSYIILPSDGRDTLLFTTLTDISFYRDFANDNLVIKYGENDKITLKDYYKENTTHSVTTIINGNTTYSIPDAIDAYGIEIIGTENSDTIHGSDGNDTINGGNGYDIIYGGNGNDTIYGDNGRDTIYGGDGDDIIYGGDNNDDNDDIFTGKGNDTIYGGDGSSINTILMDSGYKTIEIGTGKANDKHDILVFINETDKNNLVGHVLGNDLIISDTAGTTVRLVNYLTDTEEHGNVHLQIGYKGGPTLGIGDLPIEIISNESEVNGTRYKDIITATNNSGVVINGYTGNDVINTGAGNDTINGGAGDDTINSSAGNDTINGGAGDDTINSSAGNDTIDGDDGKDLIDGGDGDDIIYGGYQDDTINGGTGNDTINAGTGTNTIIINSGNKTIIDGDGVDTLVFNNETNIDNLIASTSGNDLIITNSNGNFAKLSGYFLKNHNIAAIKVGGKTTSIANLLSLVQNGTIIGTNGNDTLEGDANNNTIYSSTGNDIINAGAGNNTIYLGMGNKTIINGGGVDTLIFSDETDIDKVTASVSGNNLVITDGNGNLITLSEYFLGDHSVKTLKIGNASIVVEDLMFYITSNELQINGTYFNDNITATSTSGVNIYGHDGNDIIYGTAYNDTIYGQDDDDTIYGGNGDDSIIGGIGKDYIYGGNGDDSINGGDENDILYGNAGNDTIESGWGDDIINAGTGNNTIYLGMGNKTIINGGGVDTLVFSDVADIDNITASASGNNLIITDGANTSVTLKGYLTESDHNVSIFKVGDDTKNFDELKNSINSDNETITGSSFHDSITSTSGDRAYIYAGAGNDLIYVSANITHIEGGDGNDTIHGNNGWDNIYGGNGDDKIYGGETYDTLQGGNGNDTIYGEAGDDGISGDGGDDVLYGGDGKDTINGGSGNDEIHGGNHNDTIDGGTGNDEIYGDANNDDIEGGSGNDTIYGGDGDDIIKGSDGNDTLYGGTGNDKYIQKENNLADYDEIYDEAGDNDSLEINYNKNDIILRFDIAINGGGGIITGWSEDMYITTVADFGNAEKGIKIIKQFNGHSIENIKTADNYTISIDKINELRSGVALWLKNNGFDSAQKVLTTGTESQIESLIAEFQKAEWQ